MNSSGCSRRNRPGVRPDGCQRSGATGADELPIVDYESLAASQVVAKLSSLDREELTAVERFERTHRRRRTVLGKIEQLQRA